MKAIKIPPLKDFEKSMWERHANPMSGYARVALFFILLIALWNHSAIWLFLTIVGLITNPWWFPEPSSKDHWLSLSVRGEKIWLDNAQATQKIVVISIGTVLFVLLAACAWKNNLFLTTILAISTIAIKLIFLMFTANIARDYTDGGKEIKAEETSEEPKVD